MSFNVILIVLAVILGVAYFSVRNHRKQAQFKNKS
jgi:DNA-binding CsgD family transcriptional regulator